VRFVLLSCNERAQAISKVGNRHNVFDVLHGVEIVEDENQLHVILADPLDDVVDRIVVQFV